MRFSLFLLFLQLWGNVKVSLSQRVCSPLPDVPHAHVSEDTKRDEYHEGNVIHFACETGYISGPTIRYVCSDNGWVKIRAGECYLKPCELPDDTPNGYYEIISGEEFVFGTTIKYYCNTGYQMVSKTVTRSCLLDKWTNHVPICEPLSCETPPTDEWMSVTGLTENEEAIRPGHFFTFRCQFPGTYLNGSSVLICGYDGKWNHAFPTCEDYTCSVGVMHPHLTVTGLPTANETMKVGHELQFRCSDQYSLEGPEVIQCSETGKWNNPFPTCTDKCKLRGISNSVRVITPLSNYYEVRKGQKLQFQCHNPPQGHMLLGSETIECLVGGQWSDNFPTCGPPLGCGKPPLLENGDTTSSAGSQYRHNQKVEYACQQYHIMKGSTFKTCYNGKWIGEMTCLKPCTVNEVLMRQHNIRFRYSPENKLYSAHKEGLTFICVGRTTQVGTLEMRQICNDGVITLPTCQ